MPVLQLAKTNILSRLEEVINHLYMLTTIDWNIFN